MSGPLTKSVAHGTTWMGISTVLKQGFRFTAMIVLARLLLPEDFGVVAMAVIITSLMLGLFDMGLNQALVQRKEVTASHLSTIFWVMLALGIIFCILVVAISPFAAKFFRNELVGPVLAISSISFIICSLGSVHGALLRKRLDFLRFSIAEGAGAVAYLAVAVTMAFAGFGVWSIVLGGLADNLTYVTLRWILCRWHPSFAFSVSSLRDLWGFGFNHAGTKLVESLSERLDYLIIGRFLAAATLGFYNLGLRAISLPLQNMNFIATTVAFPAFSTIQDEDERLRRGFLKSMTFISIIGLPLFTGVAIVGPELIKVIFGQKWILAVLPMQVLCIMGVFRTIGLVVPSLILSKGRPDINLKLGMARLVVLVPCLLIAVRFGAVGVALGISAVTAIFWLAKQIFANRLIGLGMREYLAALRPAALGSAVMAMVLLAFRYVLTSLLTMPDIGLLAISVVLGAAIYFVTLKVTRTEALNEMTGLVREVAMPYLRPAMLKLGLSREEALHTADKE